MGYKVRDRKSLEGKKIPFFTIIIIQLLKIRAATHLGKAVRR